MPSASASTPVKRNCPPKYGRSLLAHEIPHVGRVHPQRARRGPHLHRPHRLNGQPLVFAPHDFRRPFITDAIRSGLPPHIAQVIAGHANINTTMGYNAIYPEETIEAHRAFITRRRALRPAEEYRTPTDAEWEDFLGHFERRKLSVGTCARAYGTACVHEHACVRCSLLRPFAPTPPSAVG
ncbi:site-specific integrase [Streptomyces sp. NPDC054813]